MISSPLGRLLQVLVLLLPLRAFAQFDSLTTIYDGSRVYFVTTLRQAGTDQPAWGKVFVADDTGIRPLAIRNIEGYSDSRGYVTNGYHLASVAVAHDASRLALLGIPNCTWGSPCHYNEQSHTDLYSWHGDILTSFLGRTVLSPNARWALVSEIGTIPGVPKKLVNLDSGVATPLAMTSTDNHDWRSHALADDGTLALVEPFASDTLASDPNVGALFLLRPDGSPHRVNTNADSAAIDPAATTVVWAEYVGRQGPRRLRILHTRSLEQHALFEGGDSYAPAITDDGRRVCFISTATTDAKAQLFVIDTDGSGLQQITSEASGVHTAAFSGDGRVAWVVAGDGSLLKIGVATGERRQFVGPSVRLSGPGPIGGFSKLTGTPGGVQRITGDQLAAGAQLWIGGLRAPVLSADASSLTFQIPWEIPPNPAHEIQVLVPGYHDPAWVAAVPVKVVSGWPAFVLSQNNFALAAHADWASLVGPESPASPGEIVHLYATGLGPVSLPVETGQPAPAKPLAYLAEGLQCALHSSALYSSGADQTVEVVYAGLAPGTIGYYQLDVRLPPTLPPPQTAGGVSRRTLFCHKATGQPYPLTLSVDLPTIP